ncbi:hypothetical protein [Zarconia navalis]|nr:hypothetical protein [Zarconia navalis]
MSNRYNNWDGDVSIWQLLDRFYLQYEAPKTQTLKTIDLNLK